MATMNFVTTTDSRLTQLPLKNGQLIFVRDSQKIYLDAQDTRTEYTSIINLVDEEQRKGLVSPVNGGFYFVNETKAMWNYDRGTWTQLTGLVEEKEVLFDDEESLSIDQMKENVLYVSGRDIYRVLDNQKVKLGSVIWENF